MNTFNIIGKIKEEPKMYVSANGTQIAKVRFGIDNNDNEEIVEINFFNKMSNLKFDIDRVLAIQGKIRANNFTKDNKTFYNVELVGNNVEFLS